MARTRLRFAEYWERREFQEALRKPSDKTNLLYVVHPCNHRLDGDPREAAKAGIERELSAAVARESRVILIHPTEGKTYIDPKKATEIRGGPHEYKWANSRDVFNSGSTIDTVTFVGGKLLKCLGITYWGFLPDKENSRSLTVRLPFDAIYTQRGYTAAQEFAAVRETLGDGPALCSLLGDIRLHHSYHKSDRDYGFLRENPMTGIYLNGKKVVLAKPAKEEKPDDWDDFCKLWYGEEREWEPSPEPTTTISLQVEFDRTTQFTDEYVLDTATRRWEHMKEEGERYLV